MQSAERSRRTGTSITALHVAILLASPDVGWAQDMRNATYNAVIDSGLMGFSSTAGWLAATCENQDPHSQGTCKGVIWATAERLVSEGKICIPMNVTFMFNVTFAALAKFRITLPDVMIESDKAERWSTPLHDVIEMTLTQYFPCR